MATIATIATMATMVTIITIAITATTATAIILSFYIIIYKILNIINSLPLPLLHLSAFKIV